MNKKFDFIKWAKANGHGKTEFPTVCKLAFVADFETQNC